MTNTAKYQESDERFRSIASATHINIVTLNLFQGLSNLVLLALIDAEGVNTLECRVDFSLPKI